MPVENLFIILSILFGLTIGSFLNVCIYRIPRGKGITGRSQCPHCSKKISWYDNLPVLSYIFLQGKCRHCRNKISIQYPFVELLVASLSLLTLIHAEFILANYLIWFLLFVCPLVTITFIDFQHRIIPDVISLPGIVIGILVILFFKMWPLWMTSLAFSFLGILCGGGTLLILSQLYSWIRKREGMGGGDVKLAAMLGAFVGWKGIIFVFLISSFLAIIYAIINLLISGKQKSPMIIPYGPFLAMAALILHFYGNEIANAYFNLVGLPLQSIF